MSNKNFINIAFSLAIWHQFHQCLDFQSKNILHDEEKTPAEGVKESFNSLGPEVRGAVVLPGIKIAPTEIIWKAKKSR